MRGAGTPHREPAVASGRQEGTEDVNDEPRSRASFRSWRTQRLFSNSMFNQEVISKVELFRNCSEAFVKALMPYIETRFYSIGDVIFKQGDDGDCMFFLHKGKVEVAKDGTTVTTLESGDVFGEMAILSTGSRGRRCAAVTAITVCDCRVIRQGAFLLLLKHYPTDREVFASEARRREEMNKVKEEHCFRKPVQPVGKPLTALRPNKSRKTLPSLCNSKPVDDVVRRIERRRSTSVSGNMRGKIISAWQPNRGSQQARVFTLEAIQASVSRQSNSECERASHSCGTTAPSQGTERRDGHQRAKTLTSEAMDSEPECATNSGGAPMNSQGTRVLTLEAIQAFRSQQSKSDCECASHFCGTPAPSQETQIKDGHRRTLSLTLEAMDSEPERATSSGGAPMNLQGTHRDEEDSDSLVVHRIRNLCQRLRSNTLHGRGQSETGGQAVTRTCEACPREFLVSGKPVIEFGALSVNTHASPRSGPVPRRLPSRTVVSPSAALLSNESVSPRESLSPKGQLSPNRVLSLGSSPVHRPHTKDSCNPRCGHSRRPTDKFTDIDPDSDLDAEEFFHVAAVLAPKEPKSRVSQQEPISHFRARCSLEETS